MTARDNGYDRLEVCVNSQTLYGLRDNEIVGRYPVSTAAAGTGQTEGSEQTPLGAHIVRVKIGAGAPRGAVFRGRRDTGEVWTPELHEAQPDRDWILSRILWLSGLERGFNRYGSVDTLRRFIYIHGTPDCVALGTPDSHGCIRMANDDVIDLFDRVTAGVRVDIVQRRDA